MNGMSHPGSDSATDLRPIMVGEVWENPVTREYATILEVPWHNQEGRAVAELNARVGARVVGEHMHPSIVERFTRLRANSQSSGTGTLVLCVRVRLLSSSPGCGMTGATQPFAIFEYGL